MDNSEFETRAFANPYDEEQDFLDALATSPLRRQLLDEIRSFDDQLARIANTISVPEQLAGRLKDSVENLEAAMEQSAAKGGAVRLPMRLAAVAAVLVLVMGLTYTSKFGSQQPSAAELAFGQQVVDHVYMEQDDINARPGASFQQVTQVFGAVGGSLGNERTVTSMGISFAKLCSILPQNSSAHVVLDGNWGAVNVIVIDNSPVRQRFTFNDERFETLVVPLEHGNLILIGEKNEPLGEVQQVLDDNLSWAI